MAGANLTKSTTWPYDDDARTMNYDEKFAGLIRLCESEKARGADFLMVTHPQVVSVKWWKSVTSPPTTFIIL
jgi:hypothetical protein